MPFCSSTNDNMFTNQYVNLAVPCTKRVVLIFTNPFYSCSPRDWVGESPAWHLIESNLKSCQRMQFKKDLSQAISCGSRWHRSRHCTWDTCAVWSRIGSWCSWSRRRGNTWWGRRLSCLSCSTGRSVAPAKSRTKRVEYNNWTNQNNVSSEPEGRYHCSEMFCWEPEGRHHIKCVGNGRTFLT